jgi:hypothetical protein
MGRSVSARPASDEKESPGKEKPDAKPEDEKPDEKRERPSFRPSKQDPFYLGLRLDVRKARQAARREIDNARRRRRRAADPDLRDKCRVQSYGLSLQDYRAMLERQGKVCGICKTPGKPLCVDHCHATGKVRGLLCRDCNLGLGNYKDNPVFTRARRHIWKRRGATTGIIRAPPARARFDFTISCSARAGVECGRKPGSCKSSGYFRGFYARAGNLKGICRKIQGRPHVPFKPAARTAAKQHAMGRGAHRRAGGGWSHWPSAGGARYRRTAAGHSGLPLTSRTRSKRRSR